MNTEELLQEYTEFKYLSMFSQDINPLLSNRQASQEGSSRADEHWDTEGPIQGAIRDVVLRADEAAAEAQAARKKAVEVASRLDALAGEQQAKRSAAT